MNDPLPQAVVYIYLATAVVGLATLGWVVFRLWRGPTLVPRAPRRPVPWSGLAVLGVLLIAFAASSIVARVDPPRLEASLESPAPIKRSTETAFDPDQRLRGLLANALASVAVMWVAMLWLARAFGANSRDLGWDFRSARRDVAAGAVGFLAVSVPVLGLMLLLTWLFPDKRQHPIIELLRARPDAGSLAVCVLSAVVVAPIVEEFLFRGVLQGWLERVTHHAAMLMRQRQDAATRRAAELADGAAPAEVGDESRREALPSAVAAAPVLLSSLLFAAAHWSHGVAPIPLFVLALVLGYLYQRTHRLLPSIVLHGCLNAYSLATLWLSVRLPAWV